MTKTLIVDKRAMDTIGAALLTALTVLGPDPEAVAIFEKLRTSDPNECEDIDLRGLRL